MKVVKNTSLKPYNSFGLSVNAENFVAITSEDILYEVLVNEYQPLKILGGGSNILLTDDVAGYVLINKIKGINIIDEDEEQLLVQVGAGEAWHLLVMWSLSHDLGGLENLSLIPGSVGAAPMQNIGAYGVEQEACFHSLHAISLINGTRKIFYKHDCKFGYRESIFKNEAKDQYFITHVNYLLTKTDHQLHLDYGAIKEVLTQKAISHPTIQDVSDAVIDIRSSKLPNPKVIGNAGSFFKNPVITKHHFYKLIKDFPTIPHYPQSDGSVKIPAGWLIEKLGFKGIIREQIGVHKDQALVLVNYGAGDGKDILALATDIQAAVYSTFDIKISQEVNVW